MLLALYVLALASLSVQLESEGSPLLLVQLSLPLSTRLPCSTSIELTAALGNSVSNSLGCNVDVVTMVELDSLRSSPFCRELAISLDLN